MSTNPAHDHGSIIIVRRSGGHDDGHHGGAWKIAFADFMTAMMAFFLVMWLTSVSDQSTKKQIAQYFNPIELNSDVPPTDGLTKTDNAPKGPPEAATGPNSQPGQPGGKPVGGTAEGGEDQALFRDPYAVLAEIVAEGGPAVENGTAKGKPDGSGLPGLNGGDAYRDPFDPSSWQLQPNMVASASDLADKPLSDNLPPPAKDEFQTVATTNTPPAPAAVPRTAQEIEAAKLEKEIEASDPNAAAAADVAVKAGSPGSGTVTISLADTLDTGMFQIGSARPTADAIRLMEKIAGVLKARPGTIIVRGHTDARPYSSANGELDNWRLSTDRAHMAYYMLMRGGLDDKRVEAIEGVADRQPSNASDPEAASNRRIEILLKEPAA